MKCTIIDVLHTSGGSPKIVLGEVKGGKFTKSETGEEDRQSIFSPIDNINHFNPLLIFAVKCGLPLAEFSLLAVRITIFSWGTKKKRD